MPLIPWNDRLSVGARELDSQHRRVVERLNDLNSAVTAGRGQQVLNHLMERFCECAAAHHAAEEAILRAAGYAEYASHKAEHDAYAAKLRAFAAQYQDGRMAMTAGLMTFLKDWWSMHILSTDRKYAACLKRAA